MFCLVLVCRVWQWRMWADSCSAKYECCLVVVVAASAGQAGGPGPRTSSLYWRLVTSTSQSSASPPGTPWQHQWAPLSSTHCRGDVIFTVRTGQGVPLNLALLAVTSTGWSSSVCIISEWPLHPAAVRCLCLQSRHQKKIYSPPRHWLPAHGDHLASKVSTDTFPATENRGSVTFPPPLYSLIIIS